MALKGTRAGGTVPSLRLAELDRAASHALASKQCSAAAIAMASLNDKGQLMLRHIATYGLAEPAPPTIRLVATGQFDLGALTAGLVPALLAMQWLAKGRLDLQRPLGAVLPATKGTKVAHIPLHALLDHTSGIGPEKEAIAAAIASCPRPERAAPRSASLPAQPAAALPKHISAQAVRELGGPLDKATLAKLRGQLLAVVPGHAPGKIEQPSPLNPLLLGWALEAMGEAPLDLLFLRDVAQPLGITAGIGYHRCGPKGPWQPAPARAGEAAVAAREICPFRRRRLRGEPADLLAYLLGGVAGHSGLFASPAALFALCMPLLAAARGEASALHQGSVARFLARSRTTADARFALGFETVCRANGMTPGRWHPKSVGLVCPSGQALFLDPGYGVLGILLTNWGVAGSQGAANGFDAFRLRVFDAMASFASA